MAGSKTPKVAEDNLFSDDYVEAVIGLCEGPIGGLVLGSRSFYLGDTPLVAADGNSNFNPFELHVYHGAADPTPIFQALGGTASSSQVGVTLAQDTPIVRVTDQSLRNKIDQLDIRLVINSLSRTTDKGDVENHSVSFRIAYRQVGTSAWQYPFDDGIITLTGKTTSGYTREYTINVPRVNNDWEIRVTKLSPDNETKRTCVISWESFQMVTKELRAYPDLAVAKIFGKASDQLQSIPTLSGVYHTKIIKVPSNYDVITRSYSGVWDGTFKFAVTDNPAWILYDLLTNEIYGFRRYNQNLQADRFSFYEAAKWCDELVPIPGGGYQPRWTYNEEINQARNALEMLYYIAGIFGGIPLTNRGNMVRIAVDRPAMPVQIFGPESVLNGEFAYQFTDVTQRINDVSVKFINPNLGWAQDTRRVFDQDLIDRNGPIPEKIIAVGCLTPSEASRRAFRRIVQANTEKTSVTFKAARSAINVDLFDVIGISDPEMLWGLSGRLKAVSGDTILLRDALYLPANTDLTMQIAHPGGPTTLTVRSAQVVSKVLTVVSGSLPPTLPQFAQFSLANPELGMVKPFRVMSIEEDSENSDLLQLTALELNVNKYGDIDNLISTGTVDYQADLKLQPSPPLNIVLESGDSYVVTTADGAKINRLRISWDYNPRSLIKEFQIFYRDTATDSFQKVTTSGRTHYIENVIPGHTMEVYMISVNTNGVASVASSVASHVVQQWSVAPPAASGWYGVAGPQGISLRGPAPTIPDFSHHLVEMFDENEEMVAEDTFFGTTFLRRIPNVTTDPVRYYKVSIVDRTGNVGASSAAIYVQPTLIEITDLSTTLREDIEGVQADVEALATALVAEAEARVAAIAAETEARIEGLLEASDALTAEAQARAAAIAAEAQARADALAAEAQARVEGLLAASEALANEAQVRADGLLALSEALAAEVQARTDGLLAASEALAEEAQTRAEDLADVGAALLAETNARTMLAQETAATLRDQRDRIRTVALEVAELGAQNHLAFDELRQSISAQVGDIRATYDAQILTLADEASALAARLVTLEASSDDLAVQIAQVDQARIAGDEALGQLITAVSVGTATQFDHARIWYWDEAPEGWTGEPVAPVVTASGWLRPGAASSVLSPEGLAIVGGAYRQVRARIRRVGAPVWEGALWWAGEGETWDEARRVVLDAPDYDDNIGLLTWAPQWSGSIDRIRIDLADGADTSNYIELDWLAIGRPAPGASSAELLAEQVARIAADEAEAAERLLLAARLTGVEGVAAGAAEAAEELDARVTETETGVEALSGRTAALEATVDDPSTGLTATAAALETLVSRVEALDDGSQVLLAEAIRNLRTSLRQVALENLEADAQAALETQAVREYIAEASETLTTRIDATDGAVEVLVEAVTLLQAAIPGLATAEALAALSASVTDQGGILESVTSAITTLTASLTDLGNDLATKASASAVSALDARVTSAEGTLTSLANDITTLTASLDDKADATALNSLTTRVTEAEGELTSLADLIATLSASVDDKASADALAALTARVTSAEGTLSSVASAVTSLTAALGDLEDDLATKASASAVSALDARVTSAEGTLTSLANDITTLTASLDDKADATALNSLTTRVTEAEGELTSLADQIATLSASVDDKASADALAALTARVTSAEGTLSSVASAVTSLTAALGDLEDEVATKASASAVSALDARVTSAEGTLTSLANDITTLTASLDDKADATALNSLTTRVTEAEGELTSLADQIATLSASVDDKASADALSALTARVTDAEGELTSIASAITSLTAALAGKADASAVSELGIRVTETEDGIESLANRTEALETTIEDPASGLAATAAALDALNTQLQSLDDGSQVLLSQAIRNLRSSLRQAALENVEAGAQAVLETQAVREYIAEASQSLNTRIDVTDETVEVLAEAITLLQAAIPGLATAEALTTLLATVTDQGGILESVTSAITTLTASLTDLGNDLATKASASAVSALDARVTSAEGTLTSLANDITTLTASLDGKADATALNSLTTRVTEAEGELTSLADQIATLSASVDDKASADALAALTARVTSAEGTLSSVASAVTSLTAALGDLEDEVATKASASAVSALDARVTSAEGTLTSLANDITTLTASLDGKADATALNSLTTRVTEAEGELTSLADQIATLSASVDDKASADALAALTARVTSAEGTLSSVASAVTSLTAALGDLEDEVATKASASAVSALDARVTSAEGTLTSLANDITTLTASLDGKADATALNSLTTRVTEAEGELTSLADQIATLSASVDDKASADALSALTARVTDAEGELTSIASAISSLTTALAGKADASVVATLNTQVTEINGQVSALSGATTIVQAAVQGANLIANGSFAGGSLAGWAAVAPGMTIIARDPGSVTPAEALAPTPHVLRIAQSASAQTADVAVAVPVTPGEMLRASLLRAASGSTRNVTLSLSAIWLDASGAAVGAPQTLLTSLVTATAWARATGDGVTVPAGAVAVTLRLTRAGGGAGNGWVTSLKVERDGLGLSDITASGLFKMESVAGPSGYSRLRLVGRTSTAEIYREAGLYIDTPVDPGEPSRVAVQADQFAILGPGGAVTPFIVDGSAIYLTGSAIRLTGDTEVDGTFGIRSGTSGERVEIDASGLKVFDAANVLRVLIGDLS